MSAAESPKNFIISASASTADELTNLKMRNWLFGSSGVSNLSITSLSPDIASLRPINSNTFGCPSAVISICPWRGVNTVLFNSLRITSSACPFTCLSGMISISGCVSVLCFLICSITSCTRCTSRLLPLMITNPISGTKEMSTSPMRPLPELIAFGDATIAARSFSSKPGRTCAVVIASSCKGGWPGC